MPVFKNIGGTVKMAKAVRILTANGWVYSGVRYGSSLTSSHKLVVISTNQTNYNLATALGNPTSPVNATVIIKSGITIDSSSTANPSFDTGSLPAGSYVRIVNKGTIKGAGGAGGTGGTVVCGSSSANEGSNGGAGGDAIKTQLNLSIDNFGYIYGGGGGGGGGGAFFCIGALSNQTGYPGGGGGGGAGSSAGGAGARGTTSGGTQSPNGCQATRTGESTAGAVGTTSTYGTGGQGAYNNTALLKPYAGNGGRGGAFGENGENGYDSYILSGSCASDLDYGLGGTGGTAGKAVSLNGYSIQWIGGNNSTQVKGAVS